MEADVSSVTSHEARTKDAQNLIQYNMDPEMEFILKYKSLPQLWDTSDIHYSNRIERLRALEQLVPIYQQLKQHATVEDVKKKINSLRSNYNRELKKYESGLSGENSYYPRVRYFPYLSFLRKFKHYDQQGESTSEVEESKSPKSIKTEVKSLPQIPKDTQTPCSQSQAKLRASPVKINVKNEKLEEYRNSQSQPYPRQNQNHQLYKCHMISNPIALEWSETLGRLDPLQRLYAKKAINDILFEAELGNLHKHSVQINDSDSYYIKASPSHAGSEEVDPGPSSSQIADPISINDGQSTPEREYKHPVTFLQCSLEHDDEEQEFGD